MVGQYPLGQPDISQSQKAMEQKVTLKLGFLIHLKHVEEASEP